MKDIQKPIPVTQRLHNAKDALRKDEEFQKHRIRTEARERSAEVKEVQTMVDHLQTETFFHPCENYAKVVPEDLLDLISRGNELGGIRPYGKVDGDGFATFLSAKEKHDCRQYFDVYNCAVSGTGNVETMARSSWLKFLRHASLVKIKSLVSESPSRESHYVCVGSGSL